MVVAQKLLVLFEHATGYALFHVQEFEELGLLIPKVEASINDVSQFKNTVQLISFVPFKSGTNALDNCNSISEGIVHEDLRLFLQSNAKAGKKEKLVLGVTDQKLGAAINEEFGFSCQHTGVVAEIIRGIRLHFHKLIKGLTEISSAKAQLGLGHSYSRCKVKFNVNRADNMIIQSINLLDQLDKDINTFSMRIREWYSYHFPEMAKIVTDNYLFARVAAFVKNRKDLTEESLPELEEIVGDAFVAKAVYDASKSSMGMDISMLDMINIDRFANKVVSLADYRKELAGYLRSKMDAVAPNLAVLIGDMVGARLISHAGSLTNLAKYPASTVQILGAEKALFRALKTRSNTPKYGLIYHSTFISRAGTKNKGRISRFLANKCSIASRVDCFAEIPTTVFGEAMKQQVEDRITFYETGQAPKKNVEVMTAAVAEHHVVAKVAKRLRKKQKKAAKAAAAESEAATTENGDTVAPVSEKKKKKRKLNIVEDVENVEPAAVKVESTEEPVKKKKKKKEQLIA